MDEVDKTHTIDTATTNLKTIREQINVTMGLMINSLTPMPLPWRSSASSEILHLKNDRDYNGYGVKVGRALELLKEADEHLQLAAKLINSPRLGG